MVLVVVLGLCGICKVEEVVELVCLKVVDVMVEVCECIGEELFILVISDLYDYDY